MRYKVVKRGDEYHDQDYREFILEAEADVSDLPTDAAAGSVAYPPDLSKIYLLGPDAVWREV